MVEDIEDISRHAQRKQRSDLERRSNYGEVISRVGEFHERKKVFCASQTMNIYPM
jgi:hypothetical protein